MAQRQFRSDDTSKWVYGFGNGSDGDLTISSDTTEAPIDSSCSGTSGANSLSATNASFSPGQLILIHQSRGTGVGTWELNKIASYTAGTITTVFPLINTYTDSGSSQAQVRVMKQYRNVTIDNAKTYSAKAWDGNVGGILAFFCKELTTITGTISIKGNSAVTSTPGTGIGYSGGPTVGSAPGDTGEGTAGAIVAQFTANGNGGGGGGNNGAGDGGAGGGGNGTAGSDGTGVNKGTGGSTSGLTSLVTATFGGAGGGGAQANAGAGGGGAGFLLIISKAITITGAINANGGAGGVATSSAGGGGGAGGSVLIKGQDIVLGAALCTASAGTAGTNAGAGGVGRIHVDYKNSVSGTTSPSLDSTQDATLITLINNGTIITSEI